MTDGGALLHEVDVASRLAREAGAAILRIREEGFSANAKADDSPVTRADLASDRIIRQGLSQAFPSDGLLSEETAGMVAGESGRVWVIDPLDGTRGFVAGTSGYAVQIGLLVDEHPVLGVVFEPHDGRLYRALRGGGAWLEEAGQDARRLQVSSRRTMAVMPLVTSTSMKDGPRDRLRDGLGCQDAGRINSVGTKVGYVVRQDADIYVSEHPVKYWDSCGPLVVLEEAGGRLTDPTGGEFSFPLSARGARHGVPFVVTNGQRHDDVTKRVAELMGW